MATALQIVQQAYPQVEKVKDAARNIKIEVARRDTNSATVKNHKACAMAVACKRKLEADGVIISVSTAYVIKDKVATRYKVPPSVAREVVSFDRNGGFEEGEYELKAPGKAQQLGYRQEASVLTSGTHGKSANASRRFRHATGNIRESLQSKRLV